MHLKPARGQASVEYVAVVALLALLIAGAATVVAAPEVPRAVKRTIRKGICIVSGDVCDSADAKARGLDPCVLANWDRTRSSGVSLAYLRIGGTDNWVVARRSDGTRVLSYLPGFDLTGSIGAGLGLGPRFKIGANASVGLRFAAGKAWELPSEAALQRFIKRIDEGYARRITPWGKMSTPPARIHYQEGGLPIGADATLKRDGKTLAGAESSGFHTLGHRTGADGTTWYYDGGTALSTSLAGFDARGQVLVEWHPGKPSSLTLRTTTGDGERVTETVSRLALGQAQDRELVARLLLGQTAPALMPFTVRALAQRMAERGVTQRFTYAQKETDRNHELGLKLGKRSVGFDRSRQLVTRELVDAEVLTKDGVLRRADCLGLDAA